MAGESGGAVAGLAGGWGQFAVQGAGVGLLCVGGVALAGSVDCATTPNPVVRKMNAKAKMWRRTEGILLIHFFFLF